MTHTELVPVVLGQFLAHQLWILIDCGISVLFSVFYVGYVISAAVLQHTIEGEMWVL